MAELRETIELDDLELEAKKGSIEARGLTRYRQHVLDNEERMRQLVEQSQENQEFYSPLGEQWPHDLATIFDDLNIPMKSINEVWTVVASVAGRESTGRFQPKVTGRDPDDAGLGDVFNTAVRKIREGDDYEQKDSAAFRQANIQRVGAVEIFVDVHSTKTPQFKVRRLPIDNLLLSFDGNEVNYADRRGMAYGRYMNRWDFDERFPDHDDLWPQIVDDQGNAEFDTLDSVWNTSLESFVYRQRTRTTFVVDFEWKERSEIFQLELPGEVASIWALPVEQGGYGRSLPIDFENADAELVDLLAESTVKAEQLLAIMQQQQLASEQDPEQPPPPPPQPPIYRNLTRPRELMTFKTAYLKYTTDSGAPPRDFTNYYRLKPEQVYYISMVGNKVLRAGKRRDGMWSIFPICPFFDERDGRTIPYSTVDLLKNRQQLMNMFLALFIYTMAHMPKAPFGVDTEIASGADVEAINAKIASGSRALDIPGGSKGVFDLPQGAFPAVIENAFPQFMALVPGGAGQSGYGLGNVQNLARTASKLVDQQISAMNTNLAEAFDSLRHHRRETTRKLIACIIANWTPEDLRRVAGPYAHYVPEDVSQWWTALEFDIVVGEEASTRDMAQAALQSMVDTGMWQWVAQYAPEVIPKVAHPIWGAAADDLLKKIESQEPQRLLEQFAASIGMDPANLQSLIEAAMAQEEPAAA